MNRIKIAFREFLSSLKRNDGMTLIEIMIVIVIIGILVAVVGPNILNAPKKANVTAAALQIKDFESALLGYNMDQGKLPEELNDLVPQYMKSIPLDPWKNPYQYKKPGDDDRDYDIWSYGADGQEGGEGFNADITSWQ